MVCRTVFSPTKIDLFYNGNNVGNYELLKKPYCDKCSSPGVKTEDCILKDLVYGFEKIYALGIFSKQRKPYPHLSTDIRYLKDYHNKSKAVPLGYALDSLLQNLYPHLLSADFIVPVPSHDEKMKKRGFNQVELIMNNFCSKNNMKSLLCLNQIVNFDLRPISLKERYDAVKNAFSFNSEFSEDISDAHIILLDDVVTSGATVSECSKVLKEAGASKVDVLTCARNELNGNV